MAIDPIRMIVQDARWLSHRYDPTYDAIHFRMTPRETHAAATFLTDKYLVEEEAPGIIRRAEAMAAIGDLHSPMHFVFHSAFCCSTLVARAFDRPGWAMSLKEPVILNDLVGWRGRGADPVQFRAVLQDSLTLLSRPFGDNEAIIVKPSNIVNGLATTMLELRPDAHALLMYAPLPDFLASIAKKGLEGRSFARTLFVQQMKDEMVQLGFDRDQLFGQTDLQIAALGWLVQMQLFGRLVAQFGLARIRTVAADALLDDPERSIGAIARLFGVSDAPALISNVAKGPAFTRHSKMGAAFDADARNREYAEATAIHADEIGKVSVWTETVARHAGIDLDPGAALLHG